MRTSFQQQNQKQTFDSQDAGRLNRDMYTYFICAVPKLQPVPASPCKRQCSERTTSVLCACACSNFVRDHVQFRRAPPRAVVSSGCTLCTKCQATMAACCSLQALCSPAAPCAPQPADAVQTPSTMHPCGTREDAIATPSSWSRDVLHDLDAAVAAVHAAGPASARRAALPGVGDSANWLQRDEKRRE